MTDLSHGSLALFVLIDVFVLSFFIGVTVTNSWALKNIGSLCEGSKDVKTRFINTSQGSSGGIWYRLVAFECYKRIKLCSIPKSKMHDVDHQLC